MWQEMWLFEILAPSVNVFTCFTFLLLTLWCLSFNVSLNEPVMSSILNHLWQSITWPHIMIYMNLKFMNQKCHRNETSAKSLSIRVWFFWKSYTTVIHYWRNVLQNHRINLVVNDIFFQKSNIWYMLRVPVFRM